MNFKEIRQDRVTIEWRPPEDDGGIELEKYTIEKCEPGKAWVKMVDIDKEVESFCVHKLQQNAEYKFRIIARNAVGASEPLESETVKMRTSFGRLNVYIFYVSFVLPLVYISSSFLLVFLYRYQPFHIFLRIMNRLNNKRTFASGKNCN